MKKIIDELLEMQDLEYRDFAAKSIPNIEKNSIIGVRVPLLKEYVKILKKDDVLVELFLKELPHKYLEENMIHVILISIMKENYEKIIDYIEEFLPYIDNWEICDTLKNKNLIKNPVEFHKKIEGWLKSNKTYTVRFGIVMLLTYFMKDYYDEKDLHLINNIKSEEYYVKIAVAWYYSYALIHQYDNAIHIFDKNIIKDNWIHNKAIQKAAESFRISDEKKKYLRQLKRK